MVRGHSQREEKDVQLDETLKRQRSAPGIARPLRERGEEPLHARGYTELGGCGAEEQSIIHLLPPHLALSAAFNSFPVVLDHV